MTDTEKINSYVLDLESANNKIKELLDTEFFYNEKLKVLYLEDNQDDIEFMKEILNINYIELDFAFNYNDAVEKFKNNKYDAFIVDLILNDDYSGFDFINYIQPIISKPIIVLTAINDNSIENKCRNQGLNFIFKKEDLLTLIRYSTVFIRSLMGKKNE